MALINYQPPMDPLDIVYYDDHFVLINKPNGILSVSGNQAHLQFSTELQVQKKYQFARAAHRLDMATSGLILFSLSKLADAEFKRQFRERIPQKRYLALVNGICNFNKITIDLPLACDWLLRPRQQVDFQFGKKSITKVQVVESYPEDNATLLALEPITGRSHQLRVHLASIGHPILGDKFYSSINITQRSKRLCLHAQSLSFNHPISQQWLNFESNVPFTIQDVTKDNLIINNFK